MKIKLCLPVKNFQILQYLAKNYVLNIFGKVKVLKTPTGFKFMTYRFEANPLTHCTVLLVL